ncbi:UDP-N-acetylglucosamine 2-epimerase [Rhizobacter sp. Root1221]|uniref:UDP-N-acetylglucosamine 2-epimerase n=1 Tax=Rhizobacter sp. Root1221 TaxID=1736433 RepID=UPI0006FB2793|nr:UDP-N-acetylglucosamine 2-epimerase [Rhizobacter sp. Root1221]KQV95919.1 UDP-N-acetyl glucosamine 2-epimerase [Rhizobacter sp. Root1221]
MTGFAKKIAVVSGSRAEYGLLYWVLHDLQEAKGVELQLVVTGMHLSPEFGMTVKVIEQDGFEIARRVEMLLSSDTPSGVAKSMGLGVIGMSDALEQLAPDLVLVLGDRFEILAAVQACLIHNIPVAHIAGGDTTEGAFDESIRHAITKMAHVHFVTNELSAQRVRQLGEDPARVHSVGSPGLDHLKRTPLLDRYALSEALEAPLGARNLLVTFHPVTLEPGESVRQFDQLLAALDTLDEDIVLWFTRPNADTGGRGLSARLDRWFASNQHRARVYSSLGQLRYLSLLSQADAVVGNSSSGLYEAPSFHVPTVDIGDRQRGRLAPASVIHCEPERDSIRSAIAQALELDCSAVSNPYGDGESAKRIVAVLADLPSRDVLLKKHFHLIEAPLG